MSGWTPSHGFNSRDVGRGGGGSGGRGRGRGRGRGSAPRGRGRGTFGQHRQSRDSGYGFRQSHPSSVFPSAGNSNGSLSCDYVDINPPSSSANASSEPFRCNFLTHSALALTLHKADRHLIYPEGGTEELKRLDPMLIAEQREQQRRLRQNQKRNTAPTSVRQRASGKTGKQFQNDEDEDSSSDGMDDDDSDANVSDSDDDSNLSDDDEQVARPKTKGDETARMFDGPPDATIAGLNIQLDSPELIAEWINQRKKRWPTQQVVQQKRKEREERQKRSEAIYGPRPQPHGKRSREEGPSAAAASPSLTTQAVAPEEKRVRTDASIGPTAVVDSGIARCEEQAKPSMDDDIEPVNNAGSDDSDLDDAPEEVSSKVAAPALAEESGPTSSQASTSNALDRRPICTHFLQGRCRYGVRCTKRHDMAPTTRSASSSSTQQQAAKPARRPHPRPPPVNPFDQPDLLRQLLRNEIEKHVDAVGQAVRFVVENGMLLHVETEEGQAEEQRKRREMIQVLAPNRTTHGEDEAQKSEDETTSSLAEEPALNEALIEGGMAVLNAKPSSSTSDNRASLYRPASPTLRPLSSLKFPPEPDPLIFLDPLRRDDPKPLLPSQLVRIAKDPVLRSILTPSTRLHPNGHKPKSLERAIVSLDALPTDQYRNAAIEMILGIACSSTNRSNPNGGLVVTSKDGRRKVSETDLFRMGLRVGGEEILAIKKLADRLSILLQSSLQLDEVGEADWALLTREQRDEMRRLHFDREAERLDKLRKLGIDV
ncbi:uncharacterized protein MEPE_00461 [Melanopsichium pennsylvanicum]|uniref:C3H1-type domain-containing protein n=2 Tax=Melanopsichium pennsylvanicum TaxID=63383 RepID=A0AAJ4XGQ6_9BASI|nr:uncharacterized protein BN887_04351 [Melanopsichium pennsylvanicum 4]SNX81756.1 uncharacterized protein MEPE_00461 [Melanopsichium pennsylvanicum]